MAFGHRDNIFLHGRFQADTKLALTSLSDPRRVWCPSSVCLLDWLPSCSLFESSSSFIAVHFTERCSNSEHVVTYDVSAKEMLGYFGRMNSIKVEFS